MNKLPDASEVWGLFRVIQEIEQCDQVIATYEKMGISGCEHDKEHKIMKNKAVVRAKSILLKWECK